MSEIYVGRTCTRIEVREAGDQEVAAAEAGAPLSAFRSERAYVLLGDAGSGKSTEFRAECEQLGDAAVRCTARDFVTLEVESERRYKTLFIDGLDEIRAGAADGRPALDEIRTRLDQLGWPNYRISCREADWLGSSDRDSLERATPGNGVAVLRLDPLDRQSREALLRYHLDAEAGAEPDADTVAVFVAEAERRGLGGMLSNPLTLELLTGAFAHGNGSWPASQRETFELACERMAREHNDEHFIAVGVSPQVETVLTAAGELCAIQLLAGIEGFSLGPTGDEMLYVALDSLQSSSADRSDTDAHLRRHALGTKLFSSAREAEVAAGWPSLAPLHRHTADHPLLGPQWQDGLSLGKLEPSAWAFRSLATAELSDAFRELLASGEGNAAGRMQEFALAVLSAAEPAAVSGMRALLSQVLAAVRDTDCSLRARQLALDAWLHLAPHDEHRQATLEKLLDEIARGCLTDPDYQLSGTLLDELYPGVISPEHVWRFLMRQPRFDIYGRFGRFWRQHLVEASDPEHTAQLLDALHDQAADIVPMLRAWQWRELAAVLLARALQDSGETVEVSRLGRWFGVVAECVDFDLGVEARVNAGVARKLDEAGHHVPEFMRQQTPGSQVLSWLDARPELQKRLVRELLRSAQREAEHPHPTVGDVQRVLSGGAPANAADLAALLLDRLDDIAEHARGGAANSWRLFWNEDSYGRLEAPKSEDSCRDALLVMLQAQLPAVDLAPEGHYAASKRADIRASCIGFNIPVEIKRESHPDLWTAMHAQLMAKYTTDPDTGGFGIYLVFWFGGDEVPTPESGQLPNSPDELREMLEASLSVDEARKITVRVIGFTRPGG